jgi:hypothetical protein
VLQAAGGCTPARRLGLPATPQTKRQTIATLLIYMYFFWTHPKEKIFSADLNVEAGHGEVSGLMFDEFQNHWQPETLNNYL